MKRRLPLIFFLAVFLFGPPAPGSEPAVQTVQNEAGFMSIEPVTFYFHYGSYANRLVLTSSQARIWYSFQAADVDGPRTPIFIFFNGGPASATSSGLMSMNTGRYTLDNRLDRGGNVYIPNPVSWTSLGHLLYIDAREAGFSYNLMNQVESEQERFQEFNAQNYNSLFDAGDYIRVLLRFLRNHPSLQRRPVVIVGESYGGTRATAMLHLLLNYKDYANGQEVYQDPALAQEIQNHLNTVFPEFAAGDMPPELIRQQFGHQVLIQPTVSFGHQLEIQDEMYRQPGSPLFKIGEEVGIPFNPQSYPDVYEYLDAANRDPYIYTKPAGWLNGFFSNAGVLLRTVHNLSQVTGVEATSIGELYASARRNAYRLITASSNAAGGPGSSDPVLQQLFELPAQMEEQNILVEPGNMSQVFGQLQPWDQYFLGNNGSALYAFHVFNIAMVRGYDIHFYEDRYGVMFLKNLAHVQTFITNAPLDLVVYAAAVAPSLARHTDLVSSVEQVTSGPEARPGQIIVHYRPDAFPGISDLTSRTIRFPIYSQSAHAVSLTQPLDLYQDVSIWLKEHGIDLP